jgi:DNA repair photolyase
MEFIPDDSEKPVKSYFKGRGSQINPANHFFDNNLVQEHPEGVDDWETHNTDTEFLTTYPKTIVNKVESDDVGMMYSLNPYQGCEHGCIYCYARNSHEYWGFSAGLDFERKILVKQNAPALFKEFLNNKKWKGHPVSISGNTDCYQPAEKKFGLTRKLLEVALEYNQPVSFITKNALILRDKDLIIRLAEKNLVCVFISLTTLNETLRRVLEPRTTTAAQRLKVLNELSQVGVPTGVMTAPIIPSLNDHEIPELLSLARSNGALYAGYTIVRLNGAIGEIFKDWAFKNFPDKAPKIWKQTEECHGGQVSDSRPGKRMKGEGKIAEMIQQVFKIHVRKQGLNQQPLQLNTQLFRKPTSQLSLF